MLASRKKRKFGFTLLELLVVISLLSILILVGARAYHDKNGSNFVNRVINVLEHTRLMAINEGRQIVLACDKIVSDSKQRITDKFYITCSSTLPTPEQQNVVTFFPDGSSSGGVVTIRNNGQDSTIKIDWLTGQFSQS